MTNEKAGAIICKHFGESRGARRKNLKRIEKVLDKLKMLGYNHRANSLSGEATVPCKLNNTNEPRNTLDNLNGLFKRF